ncbi:flagellar hook-length control protein FliK [Methylobacterium flocculans]|uniref:flagellar hook-length control protein FliK n=1 Tax=Methylobacterium flocculans TaxID=2984843 RepID=UPI0021F35ABD|nr:flagellar hook-length control protein FliK [Methylobacterium sp. FF17]
MALSRIDSEGPALRPGASMAARPQRRATEAFTIRPEERNAAPSRAEVTAPRRPAAEAPRRDALRTTADRNSEAPAAKSTQKATQKATDAPRARAEPTGREAGQPASSKVPTPRQAPDTPGDTPVPAASEAVAQATVEGETAKASAEPEEVEEGREGATEAAAPTSIPLPPILAQTPPPGVPGLTPPPTSGQAPTGAFQAGSPQAAEAVAEGAAREAMSGAPVALRIQGQAGRGDSGDGDGQAGNKPEGEAVALPAVAEAPTGGSALADLLPAPAPGAHGRTAEAAAPAPAGAGPTAPAEAPVPLGAVPMTIGLRSLAGSNTFEIRLDPKDLGRVEVNLAIDKDTGTVQATLVVDRPETLALLQRDAGNLQQALSQAGLDAPDGSISLSLRNDGGAASGGSGNGDQPAGTPGRNRRDESSDISLPAAVPLRLYGGGRGLDIRI